MNYIHLTCYTCWYHFQAKELIKRAKTWRNKTWNVRIHNGGRPKSYFLSLLVFYAYRRVKLMHPYVTKFNDVARM